MLIVDDIEMNRVVLSQFFQDDYHIEMAENGREAWEMILHTPVQIVLLDLVMPVMDGYALLTQLKQDERTAGIPVIVMTGNSERDSEAQAMEMGADAVLVNTAVAVAGDPVQMAAAFKLAVAAGRQAYLARPGRVLSGEASASSPLTGFLHMPHEEVAVHG